MKNQPRVSVIVPAYNAAAYIQESIDSVLAQTYKNLEIIIVDDGSTDNTREVLEPYFDKRPIRYFYQTNQGLSGARNTGLRFSSGQFVALLDADDIFLPNKIARQVSCLLQNPDFGLCYCRVLHFSDTHPRQFYLHAYSHNHQNPSGHLFAPLLKKQFINPLSVLIRKTVFENFGYFNRNLRHTEDWELWLRWAYSGVKFYYLNETLALYRVRTSGNLSQFLNEPKMKEKSLEIFLDLEKKLSAEEKRRYGLAAIIQSLRVKALLAYLLVGDKKNAQRFTSLLPVFWNWLVLIVPAKLWQASLRLALRIKHRLLLTKSRVDS